jgi:acetyltransferase-like isoleucine patch superfamily enzyme
MEAADLYEKIKQIFFSRRQEIKDKYKRVLPLNEVFTDRWEKAKFLGFGQRTSVYDSVVVIGNVEVGENTWIGPFCLLDGSGGLKIGSNCSISTGVQIYSHDTVQWAVSGGVAPYEYGTTVIEDNCYIGPNTIIAKGVTIAKGTIVGANSFVNRSFEAGVKIAGSPAKLIGTP